MGIAVNEQDETLIARVQTVIAASGAASVRPLRRDRVIVRFAAPGLAGCGRIFAGKHG
jgi:hypothetical protein